MIDQVASLQPVRAPKQQVPLAPYKGRGWFLAHEEDRICLPSGSVGKVTSTTDHWNTVKCTNKQTNKPLGRCGSHPRRAFCGGCVHVTKDTWPLRSRL